MSFGTSTVLGVELTVEEREDDPGSGCSGFKNGDDGVPYRCEAVVVVGPLSEKHYGGVNAGVGVQWGVVVAVAVVGW